MSNTAKLLTVLMVVGALIFIPMGSTFAAEMEQEKDVTAESMMVDLLLARPLGFASMVMGSVFYVVSYPFSASGGNADEASQKLVKDPASFTFQRPLGDF